MRDESGDGNVVGKGECSPGPGITQASAAMVTEVAATEAAAAAASAAAAVMDVACSHHNFALLVLLPT